jgi:YbgC/YbaW family acyl-CoA thioester hydrolase
VFRYQRRIHFAETDLAGIAHFANVFRYMEEAEHALWRAAGMSIDGAEADVKWPRVAAAFDYRRPLRFEDEFVVEVAITAVSPRTIRYGHTIRRGDTIIGSGSIVAACVRRTIDGELQAVEIPAAILERLHAAAAG